CEDDGGSGWGGARGVPLGCGDEEGGGRGVAVALDIAEEAGFGIGDLEGGGHVADEVYVGLMQEEDGDVGVVEVVAGEEWVEGGGGFARGVAEVVDAFRL